MAAGETRPVMSFIAHLLVEANISLFAIAQKCARQFLHWPESYYHSNLMIICCISKR